MTEYLINSGNPATDPSIDTGWTGAMQTIESMSDCMKASMSAYVWWNIIRYYGPISDGTNNSGRKGEITKKGYAMSQFSRFIRPGFYRVDSNIAPPVRNLRVTAYKDSATSKAVIVALNSDSAPRDVVIKLGNNVVNKFTPYTTTEFLNVAQGDDITVNTNNLTVTLEASSITTFVLN